MEMTVRQEERCLEIALIGELDHHAAREIGGRLDRAIEAALPLRLVLDWSGVTFMDSSGIAVVMRVRQRVRDLGGAVTLRGVRPQARKVRDWGRGIDDIGQARQPLFTTGGQERSGMGFTIMESFMDRLTVKSAPGKGTTVSMRKRIAPRLSGRR